MPFVKRPAASIRRDNSPTAIAQRSGAELSHFVGARFLAELAIERGGKKPDGTNWPDKNIIGKVLRVGDPGYRQLEQTTPAPIDAADAANPPTWWHAIGGVSSESPSRDGQADGIPKAKRARRCLAKKSHGRGHSRGSRLINAAKPFHRQPRSEGSTISKSAG